MGLISENADIDAVFLNELGADPSTPTAGHWKVYFKSTGIFIIDDAGNVVGPLVPSGSPGAHATSHENGGGDEISVLGLSGLLADDQNPTAHAIDHENGGGDEISVAGLSGLLADAQAVTVRKNSGADIGTRKRINLIEGSNVSLTVTDDGVGDEVDVEVASTGASGQVGEIVVCIDGGGSVISTGVKLDLQMKYACTLNNWTLLADQSGDIVIDVWVDTYANFPPTDADSITNGNEPEIPASGSKAEDTDISDWTDVNLSAGDCLRFNVDSCTTITRITLIMQTTRT